jgi:hypothetical protein
LTVRPHIRATAAYHNRESMTPVETRGEIAPRGSNPTVRRVFRISGEPTPRSRAGSGTDRRLLWASIARPWRLCHFAGRSEKIVLQQKPYGGMAFSNRHPLWGPLVGPAPLH